MPAVVARWRPAPSSRGWHHVLDWNGGILRAIRDQNDFLNGFATQAIGANGAWFDTNTYDVVMGTAFSGASSFNKLGAGTLTLSGSSAAFTGTPPSARARCRWTASWADP